MLIRPLTGSSSRIRRAPSLWSEIRRGRLRFRLHRKTRCPSSSSRSPSSNSLAAPSGDSICSGRGSAVSRASIQARSSPAPRMASAKSRAAASGAPSTRSGPAPAASTIPPARLNCSSSRNVVRRRVSSVGRMTARSDIPPRRSVPSAPTLPSGSASLVAQVEASVRFRQRAKHLDQRGVRLSNLDVAAGPGAVGDILQRVKENEGRFHRVQHQDIGGAAAWRRA